MSAARAKAAEPSATVSEEDLARLIIETEDRLPFLQREVDRLAELSLTDPDKESEFSQAQSLLSDARANVTRWEAARRSIADRLRTEARERAAADLATAKRDVRKLLDEQTSLTAQMQELLVKVVDVFTDMARNADALSASRLATIPGVTMSINRGALVRLLEVELHRLSAIDRPVTTGGVQYVDGLFRRPTFPGGRPLNIQSTEDVSSVPTLAEAMGDAVAMCTRAMEQIR